MMDASARRFWWSAFGVFCVLRGADLLNAITGLWVIPRGIARETLGALLPLTQFGAVLALPITILATVFTRQLCAYLTVGDTLRAHGLLRDVFLFTLLVLFGALGVTTWCLPWLCEMLQIPPSHAAYLAMGCGLIGAFLPMGHSALQATKRFGMLSLSSALAAPARLLAMVILLPVLGLSGYFLGQLVPLLVTFGVVLWALRPMLRNNGSVPFLCWRGDVRAMAWYAFRVGISATVGAFYGMAVTFVIRHQLAPEGSAAYYLITRFAEIATYCGSTLWMVLFPFAVEAQQQGKTSATLRNGVFGVILFGGSLLAGCFALVLPPLFRWLPEYHGFVAYVPHAVYLTVITTLNVACMAHVQHATARNNFRYLCYTVPISVVTAVVLWIVPLTQLMQMLHLLAVAAIAQTLCVLLEIYKRERR